jgi:hypothetical protein
MGRKFQREIEEILQQVSMTDPLEDDAQESGPGKGSPASRRGRSGRRSGSLFRLFPLISPWRLFIAGVSFLLIALILRTTVQGLSGPLIMVGIGLFVAAYILFFIRSGPSVERRWRGRSMEDQRSPTLWDKLRDWIGRG